MHYYTAGWDNCLSTKGYKCRAWAHANKRVKASAFSRAITTGVARPPTDAARRPAPDASALAARAPAGSGQGGREAGEAVTPSRGSLVLAACGTSVLWLLRLLTPSCLRPALGSKCSRTLTSAPGAAPTLAHEGGSSMQCGQQASRHSRGEARHAAGPGAHHRHESHLPPAAGRERGRNMRVRCCDSKEQPRRVRAGATCATACPVPHQTP